MTTKTPTLSIEDECVLASQEHQRMFTSHHLCDGCDSQTPKRYAISGKCVYCQAAGKRPSTDKRNYWNPGYHDLKMHNEIRHISLMLDIFSERQRGKASQKEPT